MKTTLSDRILDAIDKKGNPCCVGLDPVAERLPSQLIKGGSFEDIADAFLHFNHEIIDAVADIVPVVKPQIAFYEKYGAPGLETFRRTVLYAQSKGLIVIEDGKRADIGSTSQAYAEGHLGVVWTPSGRRKSLDLDLLTINPYLGTDGLDPFIEVCKECDKGVFILVKTSNPSSVQFQDRMVKINALEQEALENIGVAVENAHTPLYNLVALQVARYAQEYRGERGYSSIGAVVGAPFPEQAETLRNIMSHSFFLVPGYGKKQGGTGRDVVPCFNSNGYGAVVNSSSDIDFAWEEEQNPREWGAASRRKTQLMIQDICGSLRDAGKTPKAWMK